VRTVASRFGSAQQSSGRGRRTHNNDPIQSSFIYFYYFICRKEEAIERVRWRTDVDVFVAESSEPGGHERVSWAWER